VTRLASSVTTGHGGVPRERARGLTEDVDEAVRVLGGLRAARDLLSDSMAAEAQRLLDEGANRTAVAKALGVSRAELYRSFRVRRGDEMGRR
jgi:hypothetical protein